MAGWDEMYVNGMKPSSHKSRLLYMGYISLRSKKKFFPVQNGIILWVVVYYLLIMYAKASNPFMP